MHEKTASTLALVLTLTGCATTKPAAQSTQDAATTTAKSEAPPQPALDPKVAMARELEPLPSADVSTTNGSLKAQMETSGKPVVAQEDGYIQVDAPLGETEYSCLIYPEAKDLGEILRIMISGTVAEAALQHTWIDVRGDHANGWGYLLGRAAYTFETEQGKALGDFKIGGAVRGETTVVCLHDAPGYYQSFERAMRTFLGSLETAENRDVEKPSFESVTRTRLPGRLVSITRTERKKGDKGHISNVFSARISIGPEGALETSDDASAEVYDLKGVLQSGAYISTSAGQTDYDLELALEKKDYHVKGTLQDKPIEAEFRVAGGILGGEKVDQEACAVRDGKKPEAVFYDYEPSMDPLKAVTSKLVKAPTADADVVATLGEGNGPTITGKLGKDCDLDKGTINVGTASIEIERIFSATPEGQ